MHTNYSDCEQQGVGLEVYQKKLQQEKILLREGWIEWPCDSLMYYLNYNCNEKPW